LRQAVVRNDPGAAAASSGSAAPHASAKKLAFPKNDRPASQASREKSVAAIAAAAEKLSRSNVEVYGSIYVKTDGERLIAAFKIESDSPTKRWHYYEYRLTPNGTLIPRHEVGADEGRRAKAHT